MFTVKYTIAQLTFMDNFVRNSSIVEVFFNSWWYVLAARFNQFFIEVRSSCCFIGFRQIIAKMFAQSGHVSFGITFFAVIKTIWDAEVKVSLVSFTVVITSIE